MRKYFILIFIAFSIVTATAQTPGTEKWATQLIEKTVSCPAIASDGTLYLALYGSRMIALNPEDGSTKWTKTTDASYLTASPVIGNDGTIYLASTDDKLYAVNPDGSEKWVFEAGGMFEDTPVIGTDNTIYVGSYDGELYAIGSDGNEVWSKSYVGNFFSTGVISGNGVLYIASTDFSTSNFYAIDPADGSIIWTVDGIRVCRSPAIGVDGTIYIPSYDGGLYAVSANGEKKWRFVTTERKWVQSSPVIGTDRTIYVPSNDSKLYAIHPNGTKKWEFVTGSSISCAPVIDNNGIIYLASGDEYLYAINPDGTEKWKYNINDGAASDLTISDDGILYICNHNNRFQAIYTGSQGLANSIWPKCHQNLRNNGRVQGDLNVSDVLAFEICNTGNNVQHGVHIQNNSGSDIIIHACQFQSNDFSLLSSLPMTITSGQTRTLSVQIAPNSTALYETGLTIDYEINFEFKKAEVSLQHGIFMSNDDPELLYTATQAIDAFNQCLHEDENSVATMNNKGVLLRLLGELEQADAIFSDLISKSMNQRYGYSGIKMNLGVTRSDQEKYVDSHEYFSAALSDIIDNLDNSALAPQIYYNEAWDAYQNDNFIDVNQYLVRVITHQKKNDYLLAKAYVLLGAMLFRNGKSADAANAFNKAVDLDPVGPIGEIARHNLGQLTGVDSPEEPAIPEEFALLPNYPNPFNPSTHIQFDLPENGQVLVEIYNVVGQRIRTLLNNHLPAGHHELEWNGRDEADKMVESGIYIIRMKAGNLQASRKITLLK